MRPYPQELRVRVVAAVEQGELSISEVVSLFNVGKTFVKKMLRLHRNGDDLAPRHAGGSVPSIQEAEQAFLREQIAEQPDASLEELQTALLDQQQVSVSKATLSRALLALNLPRKKRVFSPRSVTKSGETSSAA
jgi:transposase